MLRAGEEACLGSVVAADVRVRDAGKDRELLAQVLQDGEVFARLVLPSRLIGEERRSIEAKAGTDAHGPLWRTRLADASERLQPRQGKQRRAGAKELSSVRCHERAPQWFKVEPTSTAVASCVEFTHAAG